MRAWGQALGMLVALAASLGPEAGRAEGDAHAHPPAPAPGLRYELPEPGSYELPAIDRVSEHRLLASDGRETALLGLAPGQVAVVAFVYLACTDATGCPLALASLQRVDRALAARPELASRVRLVTVSFDPARDRPPQLAALRRGLAPRADWRFLTAGGEAELQPVLRDFGQDAVPLLGGDDAPLGLLRHVTKVFLVDHAGGLRNIYSSGFLDHRLILRDLETLLGPADG